MYTPRALATSRVSESRFGQLSIRAANFYYVSIGCSRNHPNKGRFMFDKFLSSTKQPVRAGACGNHPDHALSEGVS